MPEIDRLLGKLNVTLATFIMDPGILFTFFGDPELSSIGIQNGCKEMRGPIESGRCYQQDGLI